MALSKNLQTKFGVEITNVYFRVEGVSILQKTVLQFILRAYKDKTKSSIEETMMFCEYVLDGENPLKQAYMHIKSLPEYAGVVDC